MLCSLSFVALYSTGIRNTEGRAALEGGTVCVCVGGVLISDQVTSPPQSLQKPRGQSLAPVGLLQEIRT